MVPSGSGAHAPTHGNAVDQESSCEREPKQSAAAPRRTIVTKLSRRKFIRNVGAGGVGAVAATAVAAPAIAQGSPEVRWRLTTSWPKSLDTLYGATEFFAKRVAEITDNKFQIQVFAAGEIVPGLQVLDAVQNSTVEAGNTALYYYFGKDVTFTFGTDLPFGLNSRMKNAWYLHGGGQQLMDEFLRSKYNCTGFISGSTNCQMGGWFRKEINTPDDLKGLKFRLGGFAGLIMQKVGVIPQQIAGGDIYPALEKGTIDAAEWVGPYDDEKLGFYKVAKHYYYPGWWEPGSTIHYLFNIAKWNELPKPYQAALHAAAGEAGTWMTSKYDAQNPAALKRLAAAGAVLKPFPQEVMDTCYKAANELYAELSAKNEWFKKMYDHLSAFRSDQYLWWQVAEYTMDSYQIRYRNQKA
jgi:TRAP-type mannitol/chloroaromatic compound transport system substrate-binding protein